MFLRLQAYERPGDLAAALQLLNRPGFRALAGGTAAVGPVDAETTGVVDLGGLGLRYSRLEPDVLVLGAMTTLDEMVRMPELLLAGGGILEQAVEQSGPPTLLNRATAGGAVACPERAPDLAAALLALGARVVTVRLADGNLVRTESDLDTYWSERRGALIEAIRIPVRPVHGAIERVSRTPRDPATVTVVVTLQYDGAQVRNVRIAAAGLGPVPFRLTGAEAALEHAAPIPAVIERAAEQAQTAATPPSDLRGSGAYRRHLAGVLTRRAIVAALGPQGRM